MLVVYSWVMPNQPSKDTKRLVVPVPIAVAEKLAVLAARERRSISNYLQGVVLDHINQLEPTPQDMQEIALQQIKRKFGEVSESEPEPQTQGESDLLKMMKEKAEEAGMQVQTIKRRTKIKDGALSG